MNHVESATPLRRKARHGLLLLGLLLLFVTDVASALQAPSAPVCQSLERGVRFPRQESYGAAVVRNPARRKPQLATRRDRAFRTTIREAAAGEIDFAGHYAVAKWGCGTGCLGFAVVDVLTGRVYDPAFREVDFHYPETETAPSWSCFADMVNYSATSRLLVVEGCPAGALCGRHFFSMGTRGLREILYDPDTSEAGPPASKVPTAKSAP